MPELLCFACQLLTSSSLLHRRNISTGIITIKFSLSRPVQVLMIGDDLVNDVGGAQHCGMKGVQVRTGKYRSVVPQCC